jgi:hypothetical protein
VDKLVVFVQKNGIQFEVRLDVRLDSSNDAWCAAAAASVSGAWQQVLQQLREFAWCQQWMWSCCHSPPTAHLLSCAPWRARLAVG